LEIPSKYRDKGGGIEVIIYYKRYKYYGGRGLIGLISSILIRLSL
jgi:hypothetical protein